MAEQKYYNYVGTPEKEYINLTQDDVEAQHVENGKWFHDRTGKRQQGTNKKTVDASGATATKSTVLEGCTFGKGNEMQEGEMPNKSGADVVVTSKDGTIIPWGCYDGSGKAKLSGEALANLVPGNIKKGAKILDVEGDYGPEDMTAKEKVVTPTFQEQVFVPADDGVDFYSSVKVEAVKVTETENEFGGITATIG